ncbi:hypothetical protein IEQ44_14795 [Nocardioides sp. Y6]|uniref:Uncharacterized protein n=1 Tax=Nocardioides malaquae TaxID=2773426 RepID=A0ABR9RWE8_9ACTN|nr:hypothetical protein [Nocardioides malaquae]MBE7325916.1 hypothetical protein [Nocardioides malaquae]
MSEQVQFDSTLALRDSPDGAGFARWHAGGMLRRRPGSVPEREPRGRGRATLWLLAVVVALGLLVAIEVGSPRQVDPTGVDELEVPWADPDPEEFVDGVDHAWWPLRPGARWVHEGVVDGVSTSRTTTVLTRRREVAGVAATVVREVTRPRGARPTVVERWYAQDRRGHLWLLGQDGSWALGADVPAGLVLAAEPRRGDAHLRVPLSGVEREVVEVAERGEAVVVPAGEYADLLRTVERLGADRADAEVVEVRWAEGVGPVQWMSEAGHLDLVSHDPGE